MTDATLTLPRLWRPGSAAEYHADTAGDRPSLSASIAGTLVSRSPLHAWRQHPRLGNVNREPSAAMERGTLVHALVLGTEAGVEVIEADSFRSKGAQEARDAARAAGRIPLLAAEYAEVEAMADAVRTNLRSLGITLDGESEIAVSWEEDSSLGPVLCRGMMDHLVLDRGLVMDLKTTRDAHPLKCARSMVEYNYDVQWAAYTSAVAALRPDLAGRVEMLFLFVESEPPYCVTPVLPDGSMRELGEMRWGRAVETWARCLAADYWPAYATEPIYVSAPPWALQIEELAS